MPMLNVQAAVKVMVVDDSGFMRLALRKMLERDPTVKVIGEATNGEEATRLAQALRPDVITMDVEMPGLDGIEATTRIMASRPTPIIMISSVTRFAAEVTVRALERGAVDYISKASSYVSLDIVGIERELLQKVHYWAQRRHMVALTHGRRPPARDRGWSSAKGEPLPSVLPRAPEVIVIGASTGGPRALPELFAAFTPRQTPIVIALHMPPLYTESFAGHLAQSSGHAAREGAHRLVLKPGMVVVAPGGTDTRIVRDPTGALVLEVALDPQYGIHPSVDALFISTAQVTRDAVGVVMTGMGEDGCRGAEALRRNGSPVLAQSEASCLVYGMPRAVVEAGHASAALDVPELARRLAQWAR